MDLGLHVQTCLNFSAISHFNVANKNPFQVVLRCCVDLARSLKQAIFLK